MGFINNLNWRYATKKFDGKKVPADVFNKILEAIQMTPSAFGIQPYHITIVENEALKNALKPHAGNQEQITTCSHLLIFSANADIDKRVDEYLNLAFYLKRIDIINDPEYDYGKEAKIFAKEMGSEWTAKQTYIALGFALSACTELNVDSCPIEWFEPISFKKILDLPKNLEPKVILAVGYRSFADNNAQLPKIRFDKIDLFDFK